MSHKAGHEQGPQSEEGPSQAAKAVRGPNTLVNKLKPKETPAEATAEMAVSGLVSNAVTAAQFSKFLFGDVDLTECVVKLYATVERVHQGDLREPEALLTAQAVTLNTMFSHLANLAARTKWDEKLDRYLRLAVKAQAQCRATLETLAEIKNPTTVFARQANIAHGPQQVNNNVVPPPSREDQPTRAENQENAAN